MIRKRRPPLRCGATMVETAIVLGTLLLLLLGMFDVALGVLRHNVISDAARRLARAAAVHGEMAENGMTTWGPTTYERTAADGSEMAATVRPLLITMQPEDVQLQIAWPDGSAEPGELVRVTVRYRHEPLVPLLVGTNIELRAESTMLIAH